MSSIASELDKLFSTYSSPPKKIHVTWKNKDIINKPYNIVRNGIRQLRDLNPEYEFTIYDDDDVESYLMSHLDASDYDLIKNKKVVEKTDLWRLLVIYNEGGVYVDLDRFCNLRFVDIIKLETKCVLPMYYDCDFSQDIMISCPGNIIHKRAIELNLERRRAHENVDLFYLGPVTYFHAATEVLLGRQVNRSPNASDLQMLREIIESCSHLQTYREEPMCNTFIYRGATIRSDKDEMYRHESVKHWTA